jgi:predicted Zn-dependent peptidase
VAITKPLFLEEEFTAEFGNVQEEMAARSNNHFRRLSLEMRKSLGLIAKTDAERLELMSNVTVEDVRQHYKRTHLAPNMRFVIAGNINKSRREALTVMLENIELPKNGKRFDLPHEMPHTLTKPVYLANDTVENVYFYIDTFMKRRMTEAETDALSLVNTMMTETLYSKILGTARERGLVYGMNSGISYTLQASNWWFGAQVSDRNVPALLDIVIKELGKVLTGHLDQTEIDATKQYALGRFQRSGQTVGATAGAYTSRYFFDGFIEDYHRIPERIEAVTKEAIITTTNAMFTDNIWGLGVLGNSGEAFAAKLEEQLALLWKGSLIPGQLKVASRGRTI